MYALHSSNNNIATTSSYSIRYFNRVYLPEFDGLVEAAAELPRRFNFAPKTSDLYKTDEERQKGRSALFVAVDTEKKGYVTLEKWITYALGHIAGKLGQLPKDCLNGEGATKEDFVAFIKKAVDKKSPEYRSVLVKPSLWRYRPPRK